MYGTHARRGVWITVQGSQGREVRGEFCTVRGLAHLLGNIAFVSTIHHQIQHGKIPTILTVDRIHLIPWPVARRILNDRLGKKFTTWKTYTM